jgi:hypothetical protein
MHRNYLSIDDISEFLNTVVSWAKMQNDIDGVALIGSYARNIARTDSNINILILSTNPSRYRSDLGWLHAFGNVMSIIKDEYGKELSLHVQYFNSHEVEFLITVSAWYGISKHYELNNDISDQIKILYDPKLLSNQVVLNLG